MVRADRGKLRSDFRTENHEIEPLLYTSLSCYLFDCDESSASLRADQRSSGVVPLQW